MREPQYTKKIDKKEALKKVEHYCAYQERSHQEVRDKLYTLGLFSKEVEEIIVTLIQNNFLNEERFAIAYSLGKFRMKNWGKIKIKQGLKLKKVSDRLISKAINMIDDDEYIAQLHKIISQKLLTINEKNPLKRRYKLTRYAIGKGYEVPLIHDCLHNIGY